MEEIIIFPMENKNLHFLWNVRLIYIQRLHPNLNFCSKRLK